MGNVKTGIDNINDYDSLFHGKRVGLITNATGYSSDLKSTIDILYEKTNLTALYSPEHGLRGDVQDGEKIGDSCDETTGLTVYSLYGKDQKPSPEILEKIDILAFDIQDVGARFYTFLYTMSYAMESCRDLGKEFVVFDRPNPIGGMEVEGSVLNTGYKSFVGLYPIAQRYGLTIGETASLFNTEFSIGCKLHVIPMTGWSRDMYYDQTGLCWIMPSPNMPTVDTTVVYTGTCIFECTNISEGRGTTKPFEMIGAPWLDAQKLAYNMNELNLPGVKFRPVYFTPTFSKHSGELCRGVQIHVTNRKQFMPVKTGLLLYKVIKELSGDKFELIPLYTENLENGIDYLTGSSYLREERYSIDEIIRMWDSEAKKFETIKKRYHIYT